MSIPFLGVIMNDKKMKKNIKIRSPKKKIKQMCHKN